MQANKSIEKEDLITATSVSKYNDSKESISQANSQELKIFGEEYRIENTNVNDNSLTFSTISSASYYVLQILDKKSTNILSEIKHESVAKVVVSGDDNDIEIHHENFGVKPEQTFFVREFVAGEIASHYFKTQIIRPEGRVKKLTRVRVKSLFSLMYVVIDVLKSSDKSIIVRLDDVAISTTSNPKTTTNNHIKIINIYKGTKKDNTLTILLDDAINVFQELLIPKDNKQVFLNAEDIDEIENAKNAATRMKKIVLKNRNNLEEIKKGLEDLYSSLKNEPVSKEIKNKPEEINTSISTGTEEIIKILNPQKKSTSVSEEQKAKIATIIESVSAVSIATKNIKRAFVQTFDMAIDSLANNRELSLSWPFSKDDLWHATILVRRPEETDVPCRNITGCLTPVLMRTYKNNLKYASSDWISNKVELVAINSSCAGIPIKWYSENGREKIRNAINGTLVIRFSDGTYASSDDDENKMIRFVVVKELSKILHPNSPGAESINPFVRETYISAEEVGWKMVTEIGVESSINTEKLQYLISIPFYTPFANIAENASKNIGKKIIAVAHFEIEQIFVEGMIEKIAEKLAYFIQDKNCFGLNDFHSVILKDVDVRDC